MFAASWFGLVFCFVLWKCSRFKLLSTIKNSAIPMVHLKIGQPSHERATCSRFICPVLCLWMSQLALIELLPHCCIVQLWTIISFVKVLSTYINYLQLYSRIFGFLFLGFHVQSCVLHVRGLQTNVFIFILFPSMSVVICSLTGLSTFENC